MDTSTTGAQTIDFLNMLEQPIVTLVTPVLQTYQRQQRLCFGNESPGEFPLSASPSIVLDILTSCNVDPHDLARLEATCSFFRKPANFPPDDSLSIAELAALDLCVKRVIFKPMTTEERSILKQKCGGSWKLVLKFLLAGEACSRREKSKAFAGPGHSIAVTSKGVVYSFGVNNSGQLGHGTTENEWQPRQIRSLQGIRVVQAAVCTGKTMLISDCGLVYTVGTQFFGEDQDGDEDEDEDGSEGVKLVTTPELVETLKNIFVVQIAIGHFFTAVLSREGRVYTFSWGKETKLGHGTEKNDLEPYPLGGALETIPVVQISAGYCYLLALACRPSGMSVYSVGCGLGGKLGHGSTTYEPIARLIEHFHSLNFEPVMVAAGSWHAAVVGKDGRICTWGWGRVGCLGHGNQDCQSVPKVVEALSEVKVVHVATGEYTTFVVSEDGDVYSFGCNESRSLGHSGRGFDRQAKVLSPQMVMSLHQVMDRVVQISPTNFGQWNAHTFALTESGKLYAFGRGDSGQLGVKLAPNQTAMVKPVLVDIDLS